MSGLEWVIVFFFEYGMLVEYELICLINIVVKKEWKMVGILVIGVCLGY